MVGMMPEVSKFQGIIIQTFIRFNIALEKQQAK
jgi:hypothetical protein